MEETSSGCILLKKKEYDELIEKANKPPEIIYKTDEFYLKYYLITGLLTPNCQDIYSDRHERLAIIREDFNDTKNIRISSKLYSQIKNILRLLREQFEDIVKDEYNNKIKELSKMTIWEFKRWRRQYNN